MKESITIRAEPRVSRGSSAMGRLRREGRIPAIVYGEGKTGETVQINEHDFQQMMKRHRGEQMLVTLDVEGASPRKVLLKDVQHHPIYHRPVHIDFYEVSMSRRLAVEVPIRLVGEPIGVTQQGGIVDHLVRSIEIECLPDDIPEDIVVDISDLAIGKHLSVADIQVDTSKIEILTAPDIGVVAVSLPKAEEEATPVEGEGAAASPEVITEKKSEDGAGEGGKAAPAKESASKGGKEKAEKK